MRAASAAGDDDPAEPPARHPVELREAVDHDRLGVDLERRDRALAVADAVVDLVGDQRTPRARHSPTSAASSVAPEHRAGRIRRARDDDAVQRCRRPRAAPPRSAGSPSPPGAVDLDRHPPERASARCDTPDSPGRPTRRDRPPRTAPRTPRRAPRSRRRSAGCAPARPRRRSSRDSGARCARRVRATRRSRSDRRRAARAAAARAGGGVPAVGCPKCIGMITAPARRSSAARRPMRPV